MSGAPRLRARLLVWLVITIVVAALGSALVVVFTRPDASQAPRPIVARAMAARLARTWDDQPACEAYVREVGEATGFDLRLRADPATLPRPVRRATRPVGQITFAPGEGAFLPIVRRGEVVGAVQFDAEPTSPGWLRAALALLAAVGVLVVAADRVARRLARPLEEVAAAADRFGSGDLSARAAVDPTRAESVEAEHLAMAFNGMAERVERTVRDQRELLAAVSHELRSPLGRAEVALAIARERSEAAYGDDDTPTASSPDAERVERSPTRSLDDVAKQLREVDAILGDLLAVSRAGLTDVRATPLDLVPWLRAHLARQDPPVELEIDASLAPSSSRDGAAPSLQVAADAPLLARALDNLLRNARVHGHPPSEPLLVRLIRRGDRVRLEVHDRGPGFPPDLLARAFDPFVRGDRSRPHGSGAGIGLALVKRIAEAHGGAAFALNRSAPRSEVPDGATEPASSPHASAEPGAVVGFELPVHHVFGSAPQPS